MYVVKINIKTVHMCDKQVFESTESSKYFYSESDSVKSIRADVSYQFGQAIMDYPAQDMAVTFMNPILHLIEDCDKNGSISRRVETADTHTIDIEVKMWESIC